MRRLGRGFGIHRHWGEEQWFRDWEKRGRNPTTEQLIRRNDLRAFRLVLAGKEPKS